MGIIIFQWKLLHVGKKILPDFLDDLLCRDDHQLVVAKCCRHTAQVKDGHTRYRRQKSFHIPRKNKFIDNRFQQIRPQNIGSGTDQHKHRHQKEHPLVSAKIVHQMPHCPLQIFWSFISQISCH